MDIKEKIFNYCESLGLDTVGVTKARRFNELYDFLYERKVKGLENEFEEIDIEKRINPNHYMSNGKAIISIAFPYFHKESNNENGFSVYTQGKDYHYVVKSYLDKICNYIVSLGGSAIGFVDSNTLPERYIAYLCGIGFIGRNNMLITKKYGSYVFLGEIITDLDIGETPKRMFSDLKRFEECGECRACYKECPTKSINVNRNNPNICMSYITQSKDIDEKFLKLMGNRIFGCDTCQFSCPYNKDITLSNIDEFKPLDFMKEFNLDNIINLNNSEFKNTYKNTSCGWRGKNTLIRNAMIKSALHNRRDISRYVFSSDKLKEYQIRLLKYNNV